MNTNLSVAEKELLKAARAYRHLSSIYRLQWNPSEVLLKLLKDADAVVDSYRDTSV